MLTSNGYLESLTDGQRERIYRFLVGAKAPPLPGEPAGSLVLLRLLAEFGAGAPDQGVTQTGEWIRLPFRGFVRSPTPKAWCTKVYYLLLEGPMRSVDLCAVLECDRSRITLALHDLNQEVGVGFLESRETLLISMHFSPLPSPDPALHGRGSESN